MVNTEIWLDITGYEGRYKISNKGRVKTLLHKEDRILTPCIDGHGYYSAYLYDKDIKRKTIYVHRLVAIAFVENRSDFNIINHIDENKLNNNSDNLEWCTHSQNISHGTCMKRMLETKKSKSFKEGGKKVFQYDLENNLLNTFNSCAEASRITGIATTHICDCCNKKKKCRTAGGFIWKYQDHD